MAFNFMNKNNITIISTLILVILISQSKIFNFFMDDYLGKFLFIVAIILIATFNKIAGLLIILVIILMFNKNDNYVVSFKSSQGGETLYNSIEGFDNYLANNDDKKLRDKLLISSVVSSTENNTNSEQDTTTSETFKSAIAREGFCLVDKETTILRGKPSNQINISNIKNASIDDIRPAEEKTILFFSSNLNDNIL